MDALIIQKTLIVHDGGTVGNDSWLYADSCYTPDDFKKMPNVIEYEGRKYGKTGWNSDTGHCHYATWQMFANIVS